MSEHSKVFKSIRLGFRVIAVSALFSLVVAGNATAQKFTADPVKIMDRRTQSSLQGRVRKMMKSGPLDAQEFDQWYNKYYLASMTSPKTVDLAKLAAKRRGLIKDLGAASNDGARQTLIKLVKDKAQAVVAGNYHPSVKFNFAYLLGQLNEQEAPRQPPVPLKSALPTLVQWAANGKSDAVKVAALLGIQRHMELRGQFPLVSGELSSDEKNRVTTLLKGIVEAKAPPKGRSASGHHWMQTIAAETMGYVADPKTVTSLGKLVAQSNASLPARCAATKALGRIDLSSQASISGKLVAPIARLAADCCSMEQSKLAQLANNNGNRREQFDMQDEEFSDPRSVPSRRRLLACLLDIKAGLAGPNGDSGLKATAPTAAPLLQQLDATIEALQDVGTDVMELSTSIQQQASRFKTLASS